MFLWSTQLEPLELGRASLDFLKCLFLKQLAECFSSAPVGPRWEEQLLTIFIFFCLMAPGCTHYLRSLGSSNELCGSPPLSQRDLQYVSVPLMKSSPYFPLGISVSLRGSFELFGAEGGQYPTSVARWLLWIWSFARLLHHRTLTGYPLDVCCQSTPAACIPSFVKNRRTGRSLSKHVRKTLSRSISSNFTHHS